MGPRLPNHVALQIRHVARRVRHLVRPGVTITAPPDGVDFERDVEVRVRDGCVLRVNVFRPDRRGEFPVLLCAHPYGKDALPKPRRGGYAVPTQFRLLPQSRPFSISAWTGWEGPDPGHWVPRGYVVVNCDLRGWGRSDGVGELLSHREGDDVHDLIEWAAVQPWSNGRVGTIGVSYLAITQWAAAATRPAHLEAICPWEGFTDAYRDFARPGGIREDGFILMWSALLRRQRRSPLTLRAGQRVHRDFDAWWAARNRDIERIEVPALVCGSFSDHDLHSRGSHEGFRRIGSRHKWLYTHRGPKWATFYAPEALAFQARFFDHFLRGDDTGVLDEPPVRVEVRSDAATVTSVRGAPTWPPPEATWRALGLDATRDALVDAPPAVAPAGTVAFDTRTGHATFTWRVPDALEIVGPMCARLHVEMRDANDVHLFVGVRKLHHGEVVGFEGSYGFDEDLVTHGMLKASHRRVDPARSLPGLPFHPYTDPEPLRAGEVVAVDVELSPSATSFAAGDELQLEVRGRWFFPRNPLLGQFPAGYERSPRGTCVLHCGGPRDAALHVPVIAAVDGG